MNFLFINPPWHQKTDNMWKYIKSCMPPFGLALLGTLLKERGHKVEILDCNAERIGTDNLADFLPGSSWDYIGITATTSIYNNAIKAARTCKTRFPGTPLIMGGVHPSVFPEEPLSTSYVDYVIRCEGEDTLMELVSGMKLEEIHGLSFKSNGKIVNNKARPSRPTISDLPMISYDLLPVSKYSSALGSYLRTPSMGMVVSRGCPGRCSYCYGKYLGNKIRFRTSDQIVDEINFLVDNYNIREISFYDDTFTTFPSLVNDVCTEIVSRKLDITWSCFSRIDRVNEETLSLMKKAGCHQIMYGIESGDPKILKNINKNIDLDRANNIVKLTQKAGINVRAAFMFGNIGETEFSMKKTINYAKKLKADFAVFNITTPFPGSEMYTWADENGYLLTKDWSKYDLATIVNSLPSVNQETIKKYYRKAYKNFYLRPNYILKRFFKMRTLNDLKMNYYAFRALINF